MVTFRIRDGYLEQTSRIKFADFDGKLPQSFTVEGVDLSQAALTPEQALTAQLPAMKGLHKDTLEWAWKNYTYQAARDVLATLGIEA